MHPALTQRKHTRLCADSLWMVVDVELITHHTNQHPSHRPHQINQPTHITPTNQHTNQHTSHQPTHITPTNQHTNQHTSHQPTNTPSTSPTHHPHQPTYITGQTGGCYDTKTTSSAWIQAMRADIINGPTRADGSFPPFSWTPQVCCMCTSSDQKVIH